MMCDYWLEICTRFALKSKEKKMKKKLCVDCVYEKLAPENP